MQRQSEVVQEGVLLVLVAHNGRTLQLDVQPQTRVDAVQQALVSFTGVSIADQIVMCNGARLDPAKPLAAYKLPVPDPAAAEDQPVFLYNKEYLRPGAKPPPSEPLPALEVSVPPLVQLRLPHPLHSAPSPAIRALPAHEATFAHHLSEARAYWDASQQRMHAIRQLMSEQEVQARAADAARANVEGHYAYILNLYQTFADRYVEQHRSHAQLLARFSEAMSAIAATELLPQLQHRAGSSAGASASTSAAASGAPSSSGTWRRLADLQPQARLQEWYETCRRSHDHFALKVSELEGLFAGLKGDVEALFMQAPTVDLDALGRQLGDAEQLIDDQGSIVQVLSKDLRTVRELVETTVQQLGAGVPCGPGSPLSDACAALEPMADIHTQQLLPRVRDCDRRVAGFAVRCAECKARMGCDVVEQLQRISAQQSKIRDMKHKLAAFGEVLQRQAAAFGELRAVHRLPAAYRFCLTECLRRKAWHEMYAGQAVRLAEHMAKIREKEAAKRESFQRQVERYIPQELLSRAGLLMEPPHCEVSVPAMDPALLPVTLADIQHLPAAVERAAAELGASHFGIASVAGPPPGAPSGPPVSAPAGGPDASALRAPVAAGTSQLAVGGGGAHVVDAHASLELENARLRAELATQMAAACVRELQEEAPSSAAASGVGAGRMGLQNAASAASSSSSTASSVQLGASLPVGSSAAAAGPSAAAAVAGGRGVRVVPAVVRAPLPAVTERLQQQQPQPQQQQQSQQPQPQALTTFQTALRVKDSYISQLQRELQQQQQRAGTYEARIAELEAALWRTASGSAAAAGAAGTDHAAGTGQSSRRDAGVQAAAAGTNLAGLGATSVAAPAAAAEALGSGDSAVGAGQGGAASTLQAAGLLSASQQASAPALALDASTAALATTGLSVMVMPQHAPGGLLGAMAGTHMQQQQQQQQQLLAAMQEQQQATSSEAAQHQQEQQQRELPADEQQGVTSSAVQQGQQQPQGHPQPLQKETHTGVQQVPVAGMAQPSAAPASAPAEATAPAMGAAEQAAASGAAQPTAAAEPLSSRQQETPSAAPSAEAAPPPSAAQEHAATMVPSTPDAAQQAPSEDSAGTRSAVVNTTAQGSAQGVTQQDAATASTPATAHESAAADNAAATASPSASHHASQSRSEPDLRAAAPSSSSGGASGSSSGTPSSTGTTAAAGAASTVASSEPLPTSPGHLASSLISSSIRFFFGQAAAPAQPPQQQQQQQLQQQEQGPARSASAEPVAPKKGLGRRWSVSPPQQQSPPPEPATDSAQQQE